MYKAVRIAQTRLQSANKAVTALLEVGPSGVYPLYPERSRPPQLYTHSQPAVAPVLHAVVRARGAGDLRHHSIDGDISP